MKIKETRVDWEWFRTEKDFAALYPSKRLNVVAPQLKTEKRTQARGLARNC